MYVRAGRPAFAWPYVGVHRSTSLMSSSLLLQHLTDKMKCSFFQAAVVSILLYGCTTWTLTKWLEKKLDDNYTRMLQAILNKSWRQHPTRYQLYSHLPPITKTIQVRWTIHHSRQQYVWGMDLTLNFELKLLRWTYMPGWLIHCNSWCND